MLTLCVCGTTHKKGESCPNCRQGKKQTHARTTKERGYGHDWRQLSERVRKEEPLCQRCLGNGKVTPATECHHIRKIRLNPELRLCRDNVISLCTACHVILEEEGWLL